MAFQTHLLNCFFIVFLVDVHTWSNICKWASIKNENPEIQSRHTRRPPERTGSGEGTCTFRNPICTCFWGRAVYKMPFGTGDDLVAVHPSIHHVGLQVKVQHLTPACLSPSPRLACDPGLLSLKPHWVSISVWETPRREAFTDLVSIPLPEAAVTISSLYRESCTSERWSHLSKFLTHSSGLCPPLLPPHSVLLWLLWVASSEKCLNPAHRDASPVE